MLLLLLSNFSRVRLCATPKTAAHQVLLSLGFSRQEHWSGLPFPSPMHESEKWKWSHSVVSDSLQPHGLQPTRLLHPWDFPGKSTGVGCHCLLYYWNIVDLNVFLVPAVQKSESVICIHISTLFLGSSSLYILYILAQNHIGSLINWAHAHFDYLE